MRRGIAARPTSPRVTAHRRSEEGRGRADLGLSGDHHPRDRHEVEEDTADRDGRRRDPDRQPLPLDPVDEGTGRRLGQHRADLRGRQRDADLPRVPVPDFTQERPQERPHPVADVGEEEIEDVERPQASGRCLASLRVLFCGRSIHS